jgi:hypothetical protein
LWSIRRISCCRIFEVLAGRFLIRENLEEFEGADGGLAHMVNPSDFARANTARILRRASSANGKQYTESLFAIDAAKPLAAITIHSEPLAIAFASRTLHTFILQQLVVVVNAVDKKKTERHY